MSPKQGTARYFVSFFQLRIDRKSRRAIMEQDGVGFPQNCLRFSSLLPEN